MPSGYKPLVIADLRGGRNGIDPPFSLRDTECVEALNVDWYGATLARKRGGADSLSMTGSTFTGTVSTLFRHVPGTDETAAELWASDDAATPLINRLGGSATWAAPTLKDAPTGNGWDVSYASLNGKLFLAYKSGQDRLHVWDGSTVRRTGFPGLLTGPAVTNVAGAGAFPSVPLYLRVRWTERVSGLTVRRSEPTLVTTFTPSGSPPGITITQPVSPPGEGETHWEIDGSIDNATFYVLRGDDAVTGAGFFGAVPIATTTADVLVLPSLWATSHVSASIGIYTAQKSYKFLAADQNRLLGFGSYTSTDKQHRIEISAVVGSLNLSDAERIDTTASSYIDLDENDSGVPTGLMGPVNGKFYAFKYRQVWQLTPTINPANPYSQFAISKRIGCIHPKAMIVAEDEAGRPAIYWMSHRGPYRWGAAGLEYLGRGVEDRLLRGAPNSISVLNLAATKVPCHVVYHADLRQLWFYVATGTNNDPDTKLVYSIGRVAGPAQSDEPIASGWSVQTGPSCTARCSTLFSRTVGSTMSLDLKPYVGYTGAVKTIYVTDSPTTTDAGTPFQAYVTTKAYAPWGIGNNGAINCTRVLAKGADGVTVTQSLIAGFGEQTVTSVVDLTPKPGASRCFPMIEDATLQGAFICQLQWGDVAASAAAWSLELCQVDWKGQEGT
jgi:hypothetical protein